MTLAFDDRDRLTKSLLYFKDNIYMFQLLETTCRTLLLTRTQ